MANDFLSNIFKNQDNISPVLMTAEEKTNAKNKETVDAMEKAAANKNVADEPEDYAPAEESENTIKVPQQLATPEEIAKMAQYKRSPAEEAAAVQDDRIGREIESAQNNETQLAQQQLPSKVDQYSSLLNAFQSLKPMQQQYQQALGGIAMQQGANQIAQGLARGYGADIGAGEAGIKALHQQAAQPLEALQQQMQIGKENLGLSTEIQMIDPDSDISKFSRQQAAKAMATVNGQLDSKLLEKYNNQFSGMSAAQLEKLGFKGIGAMGAITPYQQMMLELGRSKVENQRTALEQGAERMGLSKEKIQNTLDTALSKEGQALGKSIDAMDKTTRNSFGRAMAALDSANQLETLIKNNPDRSLDKRDVKEAAIITARMLSGGNLTAQGMVEGLVPDSYKGRALAYLEKITNAPESIEAGEFIKKYEKLAKKEKVQAMSTIDATIKSRLPEFYRFHQSKPNEFNDIVNAKIGALNIISKAPEASTQTLPEIKPYTGSQESGMVRKSTLGSNEVRRQTSDGKIAIFDKDTKKFLRYEGQ
ncbi:MAG: hypothetical protein EBZ95_04830 [Chitinophagia bacterium]|nr:hypothetical protein [Chitinophagia bacterium]